MAVTGALAFHKHTVLPLFLTLYHSILCGKDTEERAFENILGNGEMLITSNFSFSQNVFF